MGIESFGVPHEHAIPVQGGFAFEPTPALDAVQRWLADDDAVLLVLSGTVGTGKTQAAAWALGEYWDETWQAPPYSPKRMRGMPLWISAQQLGAVAPWDDEVDRWTAAGLLVIDDLGDEEGTPKQRALVDAVIASRHGLKRRTIITTNASQREFVGRYGVRITDRLRQSGLDDDGKARWWIRSEFESLRGRVTPIPPGDTDIPDDVPTITHEEMVEIARRAGVLVTGLVSEKRLRLVSDSEAKRRLDEQLAELRARGGE